MKFKLLSALAITTILFSCQKDKATTIEESAVEQDSVVAVQSTDSTNAGQVTAPVQASTQANGVALNPEHGMPGHRCEIPVGAPLNSAPTSNQSSVLPQSLQPAAVPSTTPLQTPTPSSAQGLNPEHGMPGHRCDIPVGAPLT